MRSKMKNKSLCILTVAATLCIGGAVAGLGVNAVSANADEADISYFAFVDVGANGDAKAADAALGLSEKDATVVTAGTLTEGGTLFESYSAGAAYSFALGAGEYQVAVAVIAESGNTVTVGGNAVDLGAAEGKHVASVTATVTAGTPLTVSATGKLCAVLVAAKDSKILMSADYTEGQVISYGALLSEELHNATGYYSNGVKEEIKIEYDGITANTGINVNFTLVDVTGTVVGTNLKVSRYVITMPDELVYFINCGSYDTQGVYEGSLDPTYDYNQTVFDYYGSSLKNYGTPDQEGSDSQWGYYKKSLYSAPGDSAFPYNTLRWTGDTANGGGTKGVTDMGYYLTGLEPGASYRIYIGTLSAWHARTVSITFNGAVVGEDTLRINASKGYTVYEGVTSDSNGKVDIYMQGGSTNEPCINFIAVQKTSTQIKAAPAKPVTVTEIGMTEHSLEITDGIEDGAKLQIYNASRPNQVLYEEEADLSKSVPKEDGTGYTYTMDWGKVFDGISQFYLVQINNGGVSEAHRVTITDIEGFNVSFSPEGYTTGAVTVHVTASANSGITAWSYQLGEYGTVNEFAVDKLATLNESFTVEENGDYIVKVYSGVGAKNDTTVTIDKIDPDRPVISITPSKAGWEKGAYNVTLAVGGVAPVAEYKLFKNGKVLVSAESAPATVKFSEAGEYLIYVKNAAGQSATNTVSVSDKPTTTKVMKSFANRTLTYTFADNDSYTVASVTAYELLPNSVSKMTIASGNSMDVYNEGTYIVTVTTSNGTVEMFSLEVTKQDISNKSGSGTIDDGGDPSLGIGLGVGIGGVVVAAVAITLTVILMKKKRV